MQSGPGWRWSWSLTDAYVLANNRCSSAACLLRLTFAARCVTLPRNLLCGRNFSYLLQNESSSFHIAAWLTFRACKTSEPSRIRVRENMMKMHQSWEPVRAQVPVLGTHQPFGANKSRFEKHWCSNVVLKGRLSNCSSYCLKQTWHIAQTQRNSNSPWATSQAALPA